VTQTVTYSTLLLTLLLMVGLFFFIRASTKDRTETLSMTRNLPPQPMREWLIAHFQNRAYHIQANESLATDPQFDAVELQGNVRPSIFLAIFLTFLAAVGALCIALVLAILWPDYGIAFIGLIVLAPAAGIFYWKRAGRQEVVRLKVQATTPTDAPSDKSELTVTAHRDELIVLKQALAKLPE
jgi:Flp pilus assembly protein TadB